MSVKIQTGIGVVAAVLLIVLGETLRERRMVLLLMIVVGMLALVAVIAGRRLPLFVRVLATATTFYFGYAMCLLGRTMEPHFTIYTVWMALVAFGFYAPLLILVLFRIWQGRVRVAVVASLFPVSLAIASAVAAYEEYQFVREHRHGIGPTARWTVSNHWLAYDAEKQLLYGSD